LKVKSKLSRVFWEIAELGLLFPPLQQALATPGEFVGDQAREQIDGGELLGFCLGAGGFLARRPFRLGEVV
jgi:hypothetical protein